MEPFLLGQEERSGAHGPGRSPRSSKRCCGSCAPAARGATFPTGSARGARSADASPGGATRACSSPRARCFGRGGRGHGARDGRRHHRSRPPPRPGRERGALGQAIGRSKGGATTRIVALADALGRLARFRLLPGPRPDTIAVPDLIDGVSFGAPIADQACDANWILDEVRARNAESGDRAAQAAGPASIASTARSTSGATGSRTSSARSKRSSASPCARTRSTGPSRPSSASQPAPSVVDEPQQALEHLAASPDRSGARRMRLRKSLERPT